MLNDRRTCGDRPASDPRLVSNYSQSGDWPATIPVKEKSAAAVAEVAIKISRREFSCGRKLCGSGAYSLDSV